MKKFFLISLLTLLGFSQAMSQEYEYVPFVREGVKWVYYYYNNGYIPYDGLAVGKVYLNLEIKGSMARPIRRCTSIMEMKSTI